MILGWGFVVQNMDLTIIGRYHGVHSPIIIYVTGRQATRDPRVQKNTPRLRGDIDEAAAVISGQQHRFAIAKLRCLQFYGIEIMSLSDDEILPAVIVIVDEADAPARMHLGHSAYAGRIGRIGKVAV